MMPILLSINLHQPLGQKRVATFGVELAIGLLLFCVSLTISFSESVVWDYLKRLGRMMRDANPRANSVIQVVPEISRPLV
jgi:hypothetical protein